MRPTLTSDVVEPGRDLLGRVLPRDRPPWRLRGRAQPILQRERVDLDDDPVDVVLDVVAVLTPVRDVVVDAVEVVDHLVAAADRQSHLLQGGVGGGLARRVEPVAGTDPVQRQGQRSGRGDPRVLLPQRAGRRVARVGERLLALGNQRGIDALEGGVGQEYLTTHLEQRRGSLPGQPVRDGLDGPQVVGDVLAGDAVAAGRGAHQPAVLVDDVHGQAVDLQLAQPLRHRHLTGRPGGPGGELRIGEDVVEAEQPLHVTHLGEVRRQRLHDLLGRRVRCPQARVAVLDRAQLPHLHVVLGVGDGRLVADVVAVGEVFELLAQLRVPASHPCRDGRRAHTTVPSGASTRRRVACCSSRYAECAQPVDAPARPHAGVNATAPGSRSAAKPSRRHHSRTGSATLARGRGHARADRRYDAEPEGDPGLDQLAGRVLGKLRATRHVDADAGRTRGTQQPQRHVGSAAVHHHRGLAGRRDHLVQRASRLGLLNRIDPAEPARGRHPTGEHGRQARLVELEHQHGSGQPAAHVVEVPANRFGQRVDQVPDRAGVTQHGATAGQLQRRRQRPGSGQLHLEPAVVARAAHRDQRVKVAVEALATPPPVQSGTPDQPPPGGLQVDRQVGEIRRGPADQVAARPAVGQLRQVREVRERVEDHRRGGVDVITGQRPDPGRDPYRHVTHAGQPRTCQ